MYPRIVVDLNKLNENLDFLNDLCHSQGIKTAIVTKVFCADERIVELINASDADMLADSRTQNLSGMKTEKPRLLLRIGMQSEAEKIVSCAEISMQSELETIMKLNEAAKKLNKTHRIILMVDMGDLREGIFNKHYDVILNTARAINDSEHLELYGIGVNLTCYGGILPDENNLGGLVEIKNRLERDLGVTIPIVSGGNSSTMGMLTERIVPEGVNHLRLGESFVLGNDTAIGKPVKGLNTDCFVLEAEIVELKTKPSKPIGKSGPNAFGEYLEYPDRGMMKRAILAIGRQDVSVDGLTPLDKDIEIIGASSDHLIINLNEAKKEYKVGDVVRFVPDYGALLHLFTSKYVDRTYIDLK
ncbi:MAG: alanine/ornithine racemase family PLP-dependent enzyme [Clostridiales bacterium]|nr:alanine/ornithine racemase family PLP-dependent enzyme [Clostridiales bacterium]